MPKAGTGTRSQMAAIMLPEGIAVLLAVRQTVAASVVRGLRGSAVPGRCRPPSFEE